MTTQTDLFGKQRVHIEGNPKLEGIANRILELIGQNPALLEGDKVGIIDRKITLALWYSEGLGRFIPEDRREAFADWFSDLRNCPDEEAISRARRYLVERDLIRLPQKAILNAEIQRRNISRSVKK